MKDLTHYFSSPPKSEIAAAVAAPLNNQNTTGGEVVDVEEIIEGKKGTETERETPRKKRSRVKIKISVHGSRTRRCDIIDNAEDVIDKTPSPFTSKRRTHGTSRRSVSDTECLDKRENSDDASLREETTNAFEVMMTRGKAPRYKMLETPSPCEAEAAIEKSKKYKNTLKERKQKLVALADQKGYSKRKHADLEEAELIEKRLEKRAKLFKRNENDKEERDKDSCELRGKNYALGDVGGQRTPKSKAKWTMKVKLQSRSDDEVETVDDGHQSEEDHIFTPKSKMKYASKIGTQKNSEDKRSETAERGIEKRKKKDEYTVDRQSLKRNSATFGERESKDLSYRKQKATKKNKGADTEKDTRRNPVEESISNAAEINEERVSIELLNGIIVEENPRSASAVKKLAPLFVKKSKPNYAATEARRSFLQSGIPKTVKKTAFEQKSCFNDVGYSSMPFPWVSHVGQSQNESDSETSSGENGCSFYRRKIECGESSVSFDAGDCKSISGLGVAAANVPERRNAEKFVRVEKGNVENVVEEIESRCSNARIMWTNVSSSANRTLKKSPKKRNKKLQQRKSDASETEENLDPPNPTWTCKYKPSNSAEILGNEAAIGRLRSWLSGWKSTSTNDDYSSGEEFYSSDGGNSSCCENNQVAVLLGPHGSGKTASVYAIAEELEYRVLEVNASSRRTGKKLLTDFQEATKSHRVKRDQKTLSPIKKKVMEKKVPQNSLILIEDVDVIFDEDEGFVSATCQLAANTRRPIVMTCKELCPHLNKMAPRQQLIHFQAVFGNEVSALFELIALAESGYRLPKSCLNILLRSGDLRQSLLQLQYILQSGPPDITQLFPNARVNLWQEARYFLYKPALKRSKKLGKGCKDEKSVAEENGKVVNELAAKLDCVILISSLTEVENPTPPPWKRKLNPSLSLVQDFQPYSNSENLSCEIADWLQCATLTRDRNFTNFDAETRLSTKRNVKLGIDLALAQAVSSTLEHRSKSTDYLPAIRTICRTEEERARINTKRSKRFHNYLHGLNIAATSSNILAAASSVFKDKFP